MLIGGSEVFKSTVDKSVCQSMIFVINLRELNLTYSPVLVISHVKIQKKNGTTSTMENYEHTTKLH